MSTIAERVAAGAAWLDAHEPDWLPRIDVVRLNLGVGIDCIWGQLRGGYWLKPKTIGDPARLGFNSDMSVPDDEWVEAVNELTAEWRRVIAERRAAA